MTREQELYNTAKRLGIVKVGAGKWIAYQEDRDYAHLQYRITMISGAHHRIVRINDFDYCEYEVRKALLQFLRDIAYYEQGVDR